MGKRKNHRDKADGDLKEPIMEEKTNPRETVDDLNEPTMGEKLEKMTAPAAESPLGKPGPQPPSADSVHVLLTQALHADDRALLLECLYNQDEKVIANSISLLSPSNVNKLLHHLISVVQSRGAVLACALPWLRKLLLHHATGIVSQESSFSALNSLNQLIESRASVFPSVLKLSSCLNLLYAGVVDSGDDQETVIPVIFEDNDESEEEELSEGDAMDTDQDNEEEETGVLSDGFNDAEIDDLSD